MQIIVKKKITAAPINADHFTTYISMMWLINGFHFFTKLQEIVKKKSFVFVDFKLYGSLLIFGDAHQLLLLLQSNTLILPVDR